MLENSGSSIKKIVERIEQGMLRDGKYREKKYSFATAGSDAPFLEGAMVLYITLKCAELLTWEFCF